LPRPLALPVSPVEQSTVEGDHQFQCSQREISAALVYSAQKARDCVGNGQRRAVCPPGMLEINCLCNLSLTLTFPLASDHLHSVQVKRSSQLLLSAQI